MHARLTGTRTTTRLSRRPKQAARHYSHARAEKVFLHSTNGGGHASIGYWTAYHLSQNGHQVKMVIPGSSDAKGMDKPPFNLLGDLRNEGVDVSFGRVEEAEQETYDTVIDNNGKDIETVKPSMELAERAGAKRFMFISSCGIYKSTEEPPFLEGDEIDEESGHALVEKKLADSAFKWVSFRPQYPSGKGSNKDQDFWYLDRLVRNRTLPVPGSGSQLINLAHGSDLGRMLEMAVTTGSADNMALNCVNDRGVTLDGLARICAEEAGEGGAETKHYDPKQAGVEVKKAFPFRPSHFYAEPRRAKEVLGWKPEYGVREIIKEEVEIYRKMGRENAALDFSTDDSILSQL